MPTLAIKAFSAQPNARSHHSVQSANQEVSRQADGLMLLLISICAVLAIPIGWHYSSMSMALVSSPILIAAAASVFLLYRGTVWARYALPLLLCTAVVLQIQVALGTLEFHFGVFVTLALVMVYRQWRVVVACAAFFAVHHFLFDRLQAWGYGIFCTTEADFSKIMLHATFLIMQTAVEVFMIKKMAHSYQQGIELQGLVNALHDGNQFNLDIQQESVQTPLAHDLKAVISKLDHTVRTVTHSVTQVHTASKEIEMGSNDLSSRTEMACSALEETANAAVHVLSTVEHARTLATEADAMSRSAVDAAHQGQVVMNALAQSVDTISQQSEKIAEIVTVVDGLAFQTNLLALNAAVEAAHAGEHGRGFSVVAQEVRSLALRSTESARQIRALIEASAQTIGLSATQSKAAQQAMRQLLDTSSNVTRQMREIVSATHAQNAAMADITSTIQQLEHSMSQNSALAEQSSAAAASLQDQTVQMAHSVQAFKIQ